MNILFFRRFMAGKLWVFILYKRRVAGNINHKWRLFHMFDYWRVYSIIQCILLICQVLLFELEVAGVPGYVLIISNFRLTKLQHCLTLRYVHHLAVVAEISQPWARLHCQPPFLPMKTGPLVVATWTPGDVNPGEVSPGDVNPGEVKIGWAGAEVSFTM